MSTLFWAALWTLALIIDNSETFASYPADATGYCVDITDKHAAPSAQGCSDGLASLDGRTKAARRATELVGNFERELGDGLSAVEKLNVRRAAMLVTIAETWQRSSWPASQSASNSLSGPTT